LDLTYYLTNTIGKFEGVSISFSLLINLIYWLLFIIIAGWVYQKRDVAG